METKMMRALCCSIIAFLVVVTLVNAQDSSCLNKLAPCLNYLNGTQDPPDRCCDPLKSVIESDAECLCRLASNRGTRQAEQAGINVTEAQQLPARCGQRVNPLSCLQTNSPGSTNSDQNSATKLMRVSLGVIMISALSIIAYI